MRWFPMFPRPEGMERPGNLEGMKSLEDMEEGMEEGVAKEQHGTEPDR